MTEKEILKEEWVKSLSKNFISKLKELGIFEIRGPFWVKKSKVAYVECVVELKNFPKTLKNLSKVAEKTTKLDYYFNTANVFKFEGKFLALIPFRYTSNFVGKTVMNFDVSTEELTVQKGA